MGNTPSDLNNNNQKKETYKIKVPEKENNNEQKKNNIDTINCNIPEYHQTHRMQVDTGIQNYQYFKPKVNNQSIIGKIGIDTKSDNKYSFDINTLYENEKNYRKNTDCSREYTYTKDKFKKDLGQNSNNYESEYTKKYNPDINYREENNTKTYEDGYHLNESNHNNSNDYYNSQNNQYYSNYQDDNSNLSITREDAIAIRDFKYLDNLEKRLLILNNITLYNLDPLDIQSKEKIELSKLIEKYTSLRNIYHPDKGGNTTMFILINNALTNQKYIQNSKIIDKDHNSLKNDYDEYRVNEKKKSQFQKHL